jgi:hypothetical protein
MWNSNSVIAWLLARSGVPLSAVRLPAGGRAPGRHAGLVVASRKRGFSAARFRSGPEAPAASRS